MTKKRQINHEKRNTHDTRNNRANQLNPNNDAYWKARGYDKKPSDRNRVSSTRKNTD